MARIAWVDIPVNKRLVIALTYIVWIWNTASKDICAKVWIDESAKIKDLDEKQLDKIRNEIDTIPTEVEVRRTQALDIQRLQQIWAYRGYRHRVWLPCRGQGTQTNARTTRRKIWKKKVTIPGKKG